MYLDKSVGLITIIYLSANFLLGQSDVVIDRLRGPGQSVVLVNSSGELSRAKSNDATEEYSLSPVDFRNVPFPIQNINGIREFFAPIHLPDESKMESVTFWYEDMTPANLLVEIYRAGNTERTLVMSREVMGTPGVPTPVTVDLGPFPVSIINNSDYFYYMRIASVDNGLLAPWPLELVFYRAFITYEF